MLKVFYQTKENKSFYEQKNIQYDMLINSVTGSEPVTTSEAKDWGLIDTSAEDTLIGTMITSVREALETYISRDIVARNRTYYIEHVDCSTIDLPFAPIDAVSSVTYGDDDDALTVNNDYYVRGVSDKRIELVSYPKEYVKVTYTTLGLSDQSVKDAIKATFEYLYDSRGLVSQDNFKGFSIPETAKKLIVGHRTMFI